VATELRRWLAANPDSRVAFSTQELAPNSSYDRVSVAHEANLTDAVTRIVDQLELDANPTAWSPQRTLTTAGTGALTVDRAQVSVDRLAGDSDAIFAARQKQVEAIQAAIQAQGLQLDYNRATRKWDATLPGVSNARPGQGGPLTLSAPANSGDGSVHLAFRAQPSDGAVAYDSIARVVIPAGSWSMAGGPPADTP